MFLYSTGETLFYNRRVDGMDSLFVFRPDHAGPEVHALLASTPGSLRAWPTLTGHVLVCTDWPRADSGLSFRLIDLERVRALMEQDPNRLNELLTDVPRIAGFGL